MSKTSANKRNIFIWHDKDIARVLFIFTMWNKCGRSYANHLGRGVGSESPMEILFDGDGGRAAAQFDTHTCRVGDTRSHRYCIGVPVLFFRIARIAAGPLVRRAQSTTGLAFDNESSGGGSFSLALARCLAIVSLKDPTDWASKVLPAHCLQ
jgi:hypothetical protein